VVIVGYNPDPTVQSSAGLPLQVITASTGNVVGQTTVPAQVRIFQSHGINFDNKLLGFGLVASGQTSQWDLYFLNTAALSPPQRLTDSSDASELAF
jgi:hypothetical protein